ncbi:MAG TPA: META domain-containing protein [Longimicrobiales bacterium]
MTRIFLLAALTGVAGCSSITGSEAESVNPDLLQGGGWTLIASSPGNAQLQPARAKLTVLFTPDGHLGGQAGPNGYGGVYNAESSGSISIDSVGMTLIGGEEADRAADYLVLMIRADRFSVTETRLHLYYGDEQYLRFGREP